MVREQLFQTWPTRSTLPSKSSKPTVPPSTPANLPSQRNLLAAAIQSDLKELGFLEKVQGHDHAEMAVLLQRVALSHQRLQEWAQAEPLYERALSIVHNALNRDVQQLTAIRDDLARLDARRQEYARRNLIYRKLTTLWRNRSAGHESAEHRYRTPFEFRAERAGGGRHPEVTPLLRRLASQYARQRNFEEAGVCLRHALRSLEQSIAANRETEARLTNNLACVYRCQRRYAEAQSLYEKSLAIVEQAFPSDQAKVRRRLISLAAIHQRMGRAEEAAATLHRLARFYHQQKKYAEAECCYRKSRALVSRLDSARTP